MVALMLVIHIFVGATVAGTFIIAALVIGADSAMQLAIAAGLGFVGSIPLSWIVAKRLN